MPKYKDKMLVKTLGENIKIVRIKQGITQRDLAVKIGIHPTTMGKIERGVVITKIGTVLKISDVLGVSVKDLLSI